MYFIELSLWFSPTIIKHLVWVMDMRRLGGKQLPEPLWTMIAGAKLRQ